MLGMLAVGAMAQRTTDNIDRGLIAVDTGKGIFCSWRITADEYYDVQYNIYRDGTKLNSEPLNVSNYLDSGGSTGSQYTVQAVVRGEEQEQCDAVTPWNNNYLEVKMDHGDLTSTYVPNDACMADVDGDGELEILLKFDNNSDSGNGYMPEGYNGEYALIEVYKLDGTRLWWINLGPNMTDFQNNENNIVAYDWDGDGKAEAVLRAADGTVIHMADGSVHVVGDASKNYRNASGSSGQFFIYQGDEFLLYLNGETGEVYQQLEYPLKRLEDGETNLSTAWGDGYGHRSTKHFFGAPFLDGKKASIFLARGIYTRHKMIAYDVNPDTHELIERWRWNCNDSGSSWYGQGYHNFGIADVDWDGRDEIVFGSMVIDDNGNGLSTCGLAHGDAQHCSDFDPYTPGQEIFACLEENCGNNYRDATTSKIYYRYSASSDDGRSLMGNFLPDVPGAQGLSARDPSLIGSVSHKAVEEYTKSDVNITQNFRIYWDGDLCEESFDYVNGKNTAGHIVKAYEGEIAVLDGSLTNNDTKGTPCYQGDVLGDWREEVVMRTADNNIRIYTTTDVTPWRNYSLWHDFQYRQAMVWQMCGYNQPPHVSYFLGELEGITVAPPPLTLTGRTEISNGTTINSSYDDQHILMYETNDMTVSVSDGAQPYILTDNAPIWVQGNDDNNNIDTTVYTHTITGGAFTGSMRLVKQGGGVLVLPNVTETYTGATEVWGGTLRFDGIMQSSRVWLNRHTTLVSSGSFQKGIEADYNATLVPGGENAKGTISTDSLILKFGSRLLIDIFSGDEGDLITANVLKIETKDWTNGPTYLTPVIELIPNNADNNRVEEGTYKIGEFGEIDGDISDFVLEGLRGQKGTLSYEDGALYVTIETYNPGSVTWTGVEDAIWDADVTANFVVDATGDARAFVPGDSVTFDDTALQTDITVNSGVEPASITFNNDELDFVFSGEGFLGSATLVKNGAGSVTFNNENRLGSTTINGGTIVVTSLGNEDGQDYGSLGDVNAPVTINNNSVLSVNGTASTTQSIIIGEGDSATLDVTSGSTLTMGTGITSTNSSASTLFKTGSGTLTLGSNNSFSRLVLSAGVVNAIEVSGVTQLPSTMELRSGEFWDSGSDDGLTMTQNNANFVVPENYRGTMYTDTRAQYKGTLTGAGTFVVYATGVRTYFDGDWSGFTGTLIPGLYKRGSYDPVFMYRSSTGLANCTLQVDEGVTFTNNGQEVKLGAVTLYGTLAGDGTYVIGSDDSDISSLRGTISGSPIRKEGSGTWTVYSSSLGSPGAITISEGTLYFSSIAAPSSSVLGTSTVTVESGAEVVGIGTLYNLLLNSGSTLTPGVPTSSDPYGCINATHIFTAYAGSTINLRIRNNSNSLTSRTYILGGDNLTLNGTVNVELSDSYTPAAGDEIILWETDNFSGTPTVNLPELPSGLEWDTSNLLETEGILRVVDPTGISSASTSDSPVKCSLYSISGVMVADFEATASDAVATAKSLGVSHGTYILRMENGDSVKCVKVVVK